MLEASQHLQALQLQRTHGIPTADRDPPRLWTYNDVCSHWSCEDGNVATKWLTQGHTGNSGQSQVYHPEAEPSFRVL